MTLAQLDNYNFLRARLSRRYDPPEREEAHRAELRARTRRRNESADEFAENIKNLAQRAYPLADQNMLDNLVVERFREGHGNEELKKHLCLYPSTGLQDLIGACVRFETHVELGLHARKSNEGLYTEWNQERTHTGRSHARCVQTGLRATSMDSTPTRIPGDSATLHQPEIRTVVNNSRVLGPTRVEMAVRALRILYADRRP